MMNNLKVSMLTLAMTLVGLWANSQISHKIGMGFTSDPFNAITLDYSRVKESNRALNYRVSYGEESIFGDWEKKIILPDDPAENPYLQEKNLSSFSSRIKLAVGPEFPIKESKFSWGIEGLAGLTTDKQTLAARQINADENGILNEIGDILPIGDDLGVLENVDRIFISPGVQARLSFNTQFSSKIGLQLFASSSLEHDFLVDTKSNSVTPENELNTSEVSITNFNTRLGVIFFFQKG